jgi:flavin reductase (DIM6/NTAB) family NADH-FMN oxidoreductase RutF
VTEVLVHDLSHSFREVMARVCSPVAVVTTIAEDRPHGTTVSAFSSLSVGPPMVVVSLAKSSDLLRLIGLSGRFGVNVLGEDHLPVARIFARKGQAKFASINWTIDDGLPRLPFALGWLSCDVTEMFEGGDHVVLLGLVKVADNQNGRPLTYYMREFGTHGAFDPAAGTRPQAAMPMARRPAQTVAGLLSLSQSGYYD